MARQITANRTRKIVSEVRTELQDEGYVIFKTEDEIFSRLNNCIEEIAEQTHCIIEPPVTFDLTDSIEYNLIDVFDTPQVILQTHSLVVTASGKDTRLVKVPRYEFQKYRQDTSITTPKVYDFDGETLYIYKPQAGYVATLRCSKMPSQPADYDNPPQVTLKYDKYLKYGTIAKCILSKPELAEKFNAEYYMGEFKQYKVSKAKPFTVEADLIRFNELNS